MVSIGLVIACLAGIILFLSLMPKQIPIMPSDSELISKHFNQQLPGYASIKILDQKGKGQGGDPRLLTLQVEMDTGSKLSSCEGILKFFIGDPSYFNYTWNNLDCASQDLLIRWAQHAIEREQNYACHQEKIAFLLTYWVQTNKVPIDKITDRSLSSKVKQIQKENKPLPDPILLLDTPQIRITDFDQSSSIGQKRTKYVLRCDGTIDLYLADEYSTFNDQITTSIGDTYLDPPLRTP
jgi:hypothetical protein